MGVERLRPFRILLLRIPACPFRIGEIGFSGPWVAPGKYPQCDVVHGLGLRAEFMRLVPIILATVGRPCFEKRREVEFRVFISGFWGVATKVQESSSSSGATSMASVAATCSRSRRIGKEQENAVRMSAKPDR